VFSACFIIENSVEKFIGEGKYLVAR
jgi:hypothetical protein